VGNTTIITEAALIDKTTPDARLVYAHGVIVHEYEHNHCGSGVTMESPFDMWLNEAYTVDIERQFTAAVFNPVFMRLREADAIRAPGSGPLAVEDTGKFGRIVRDGFNDPDELVDGVTYVKAPEVLNMLRQLLGPEVYRAATRLYFERYSAGNANTEQFLACFEEVSGQSLSDFSREWLFSAGYPQVSVRYAYDAAARELRLKLSQTRGGAGGAFTLPFSFAAVDKTGKDLFTQCVRFDSPETEIAVAPCEAPAFLSINRDAGFYGTCTDLSATPEQLARQVRQDGNAFNRVDAMRRLTDLERRRLLSSPIIAPSTAWTDVFRRAFNDGSLADGIKGYLLKIDEQPLDRTLLSYVRESFTVRQRLLRTAALTCGETAIISALHDLSEKIVSLNDLPSAIERRFLKNALLQLLVGLNTQGAHAALNDHLTRSLNITDRLNSLAAVWQSNHSARAAVLAREGDVLRQSLGGYLGYLQIVGLSPREEVFDAVAEEERRPTFSLSHPGLTRALYVPLSLNNAQIWTPRGLRWLTETAIKLAPVSEFTTLRLIAPLQAYPTFAPDLRLAVQASLREMLAAVKKYSCPSVTGRLEAYLAK